MFYGCESLTKAPALPATELTEMCYNSMFDSCTSLTQAPELPATTLAAICYGHMFEGCTSLTTAPKLPATELKHGCYTNMFYGCTSLTTAPELPATVLAESCYHSMFQNCTSLTQAPELPATTLADNCYSCMFWNCTNLNYIKCLATDISVFNCTTSWVYNVSPTGTFVKHSDMNDWEIDSVNGIPTGWTVKDYIEYDMVDLGLSVKWADRNVGAKTPQDNGLYFDWGNVDGHAVDENGNVTDGYSFKPSTYDTTLGGQYTGSTLDAEYDAATVNMGGNWRMPTVDETLELVENTDHYYIDLNGNVVPESQLNGSIKLRSICFVKKDATFNYNDSSNFVELPFAGDCDGSLLGYEGLNGGVWSSSVDEGDVVSAHYLVFDNYGYLSGDHSREHYYGLSVRGVKNN